MKNNIEELSTMQLFLNKKAKKNKNDLDTDILFEKYMDILFKERVSDLHFSINKDYGEIFYRYNTQLINFDSIDKNIYNNLITKIQILSKIDIINDKDPSDGSFTFLDQRFRVSLIKNIFGVNCVIRKLRRISDLTLNKLNYPEVFIRNIEKIKLLKDGLIIFSGPTGSGKSTSLAFLILEILKSESKKIITIENPLEYHIPGAQQIEIKNDSEKTNIIKNILRHDPDILMTGEIRTEEIAKLTIESSITGHLVFSTIHSNNVFNVINRLIEMGIKKEEILNSIKIIFNQKFVKKVCDCYKNEKNKGCEKCHFTGFSSIIPIFEILEINDYTRELIYKNDFTNVRNSPFYISGENELNKLYINGDILQQDFLSLINENKN